MSIASEIENLNTNLTAAKNAVAAKGGTVGDTGLAGLAAEIATIPSGGTVRFIDYDGTIVEQMTVAEAAGLTSLPELPTHDGMTAEGWNYSLSEVTSTTRSIDVGAIYRNSVNARQSIFEMYPKEGQSVTLNIGQSVSNGVVIDWGDGSATETLSGTGNVSATHTYSSVATGNMPFKLTLTPAEGVTLTLGHGTLMENLFGDGVSVSFNAVRKVILGEVNISVGAFCYCNSISSISIPNSVTSIESNAFYACRALASISIPNSIISIGSKTFYSCNSLASISIPNSVTSIDTNAFYSCHALASISIPNSVSSISNNIFSDCFALASISMPNSITSIGAGAFDDCHSLSSFSVPDSVTSIGNTAFYQCYALSSISIPNSVRSIGTRVFYTCSSLSSIFIPSSVTSFGTNVFDSCQSLSTVIYEDRATMPSASVYFTTSHGPETIDCSGFTQVPTVTAGFFDKMQAYVRILVPSSLEAEWKAANVWSTYADQIVGV